MQKFKEEFNKVVDKITSYSCPKLCYSTFESYLKIVGVPENIITDIYIGSGFDSWAEIHEARERDMFSIPVHSAMGKIKGISSAVNQMLSLHISKLKESVNN